LREIAPFVDKKIRPLPNLVAIARLSPQELSPQEQLPPPTARFVSILDLNVYRKKGFHWLIPALAIAARAHPDATLDVFGWSNAKVDAEIQQLVQATGCSDRVRFRGVRPHADVLGQLPRYTALLLPSVNETFGMVYLEALLAGIPVLYTRGTGIDGHLNGLDVGIGVTAGTVDEIAAGIDDLSRNAARWRRDVQRHAGDLAARFGEDGVVARYAGDMLALLEQTPHGSSVGRPWNYQHPGAQVA
jgi:glycosyltransferase involved in cell wall biosynthesis